MPGTFTDLNYHLIFSTKHREPSILPEWRERLFDYMGGIIRKEGGILYAIGGMPDHLHLLINLGPTQDLSSLLRVLKSRSSGWCSKETSESKVTS